MSRAKLVTRNVLATIATQLISWGISFIVTIFLPRYAGDTGMGKLAFASSFVTIFSVFVSLGMSTVLIREIARDQKRTGELLSAALLVQLPLGILMSLVSLVAAYFLGYPPLTQLLIAIAAGAMILGSLNNALGAALQGQENIPRQSLGLLVDKFLTSLLIMLVIFGRGPLWAIGAVSILTAVVSLMVNLSAFRTWLPTLRWPTWETMRFLVVAGLPFFGMSVFRTLYNQIDTTLLSMMTNDQTVGWYAVAGRLLGSTLFIPVALASALLPTLTKLYQENEQQFVLVMRRAMMLAILFAIPIGIPLAIYSRKILLDILHYPPSFENAAIVLSLYGFGCILWYLTQIMGVGLVVMDRQNALCRLFLNALLLTAGGCLVAIPLTHHLLHNGAIGAAIVNVAVEVYMAFAIFFNLPRGFINWGIGIKVLKAMAAVVPLSLMLLISGQHLWALAASVAFGGLAYIGLCYWMGCLDPQDIAMLRQVVNRPRKT